MYGGAGGVGGAFGAALAKSGADVTFVARGAHLAAMKQNGLTIVGGRGETHIVPTQATDDPAFRVDLARGDNDNSTASGVPAIAGTPHITLPMGMVHGLPVGLSLMGPAWSEGRLLALAAAVERALPPRKAPGFIPSLEGRAAAAFAPQH